MVRAIFFGPEVDARIAELVAFAKAHPYRPHPGCRPPGLDPNYCVTLPGVPSGIRCVFTITEIPPGTTMGTPGTYRHLSMSIEGRPDRWVNEPTGLYIASMFGFTGDVADWFVDAESEPGVVELAQLL